MSRLWRKQLPLGATFAAACLFAGGLATPAQTSDGAQGCPPVRDAQGNLVANTNCPPPPATPAAPASKRFPYPGEEAPPPTVPDSSSPTAPSPQGQSTAPAGKRFPYPGDAGSGSAPAAPQAPERPSGSGPLQDAGSSGESSSSSSSSSDSSGTSGAPGQGEAGGAASGTSDPDANDPAAIPRRNRHKLPPVPRQSPSEREQEDVQVAGFYFNDGNYKGSYDRARDAVSLDGEDAAAQLALANAARKLGKLDEAEKAYKQCLELDPVPKVRKSAEKALHEMTGSE